MRLSSYQYLHSFFYTNKWTGLILADWWHNLVARPGMTQKNSLCSFGVPRHLWAWLLQMEKKNLNHENGLILWNHRRFNNVPFREEIRQGNHKQHQMTRKNSQFWVVWAVWYVGFFAQVNLLLDMQFRVAKIEILRQNQLPTQNIQRGRWLQRDGTTWCLVGGKFFSSAVIKWHPPCFVSKKAHYAGGFRGCTGHLTLV